jgi:glucosyl-3-phosphoglycerate synthase
VRSYYPAVRPDQTFTFAAVGRNESATVADVIDQASRAARAGDRVWFVDSASSDESAAIARGCGAEVIAAPAGKGRAIATALARCQTRYLVLLDADLVEWATNIPAALRKATVRTGAQLVIGSWTDRRQRVTAPALYWPLVNALFPDFGEPREGASSIAELPLSGLRVIDTTVPLGELPPGWGVETYLNLVVAAAGYRIAECDLGVVRGAFRFGHSGEVCAEIVTTILDFAVANGRLEPELRPQWERWAGDIVAAIATRPAPESPDDEFRAGLARLAARPLPPARHGREVGVPAVKLVQGMALD